jgi:hypothetical protein
MASKEIKVNVTDATADKKIGTQWRNGSTLVTLTPDDTKSTEGTKSTGMWRSEPSGSEINSSGGSKEHARYKWDKEDTLDLMVVGFTEGDSTKTIPPQTVLTLKNFDKLVGQSGTGVFFFRRTSYAVTWEIVGRPPKEEESPGRTLVVGRGKTTTSTRSTVPDIGTPETMGPKAWNPDYPTLLQDALKNFPELRGQFADIFIERIGINPDPGSEATAMGLTPGGVKAVRDLLAPGGTLRILQNPIGGATFDSLEKDIGGLISTDFTITKQPERVPDGLLVTATKK